MSVSQSIQKVRQRVRWKVNDWRFSAGLAGGLLRNRPGGRILVYHGIDQKGSLEFNSRFISQDHFREQISWFKAHYHLVSLEDYYAGNWHDEKLTLAITFDDGYANNLRYALPVLEEFEVPTTFFITGIRDLGRDILWPDFLDLGTRLMAGRPLKVGKEEFRLNRKGEYASVERGETLKRLTKTADAVFVQQLLSAFPVNADPRRKEGWEDYWQQLTHAEIQKLAASPIATIGSHGYLHTSLGNIERHDALEEMKASKTFLENLIQQPVIDIGFPDGSYNRDTVEDAKALGFQRLLALDFHFRQDHNDPSLRERFGMNPYISWNNQRAALLKGSYY